eukprot:772601-Prymnesium_polylepis.1
MAAGSTCACRRNTRSCAPSRPSARSSARLCSPRGVRAILGPSARAGFRRDTHAQAHRRRVRRRLGRLSDRLLWHARLPRAGAPSCHIRRRPHPRRPQPRRPLSARTCGRPCCPHVLPARAARTCCLAVLPARAPGRAPGRAARTCCLAVLP